MRSWQAFFKTKVLGSKVLGVLMNYKEQAPKNLERQSPIASDRAATEAWIDRRREMCILLLDVVNRYRLILNTIEPIHNSRLARLAAKRPLLDAYRQLQEARDPVLKFRRELDLEPDPKLQEVVERFGDAAIVYQNALARPISSKWNIVQFYFAKTPPDELRRLSQELDVRTEELRATVREYMASLEHMHGPS